MRAITIPTPGDADALVPADVPAPRIGPGEVLVDVAAAGVNRADIVQRQGNYPPPPGASELPGLEVSGVVREVGDDVPDWSLGDRVCALLAGGGYAEQVAVPAGQVLPVPHGVDLVEAAALAEVACTVWSNLVLEAGLTEGQTVLLHGGSSGIGTMGIQVARALGARVAVTAGSHAKLDACAGLGAQILIDYREQDFVQEIRSATDGAGADVILDLMGAKYLDRNLHALARDGRLVVIGLMGGARAELDLARMLSNRLRVIATSLRSRPVAGKAAIVRAVREQLWPLVEQGEVHPIVHGSYPLEQASRAHEELESSQHIGKVLLTL